MYAIAPLQVKGVYNAYNFKSAITVRHAQLAQKDYKNVVLTCLKGIYLKLHEISGYAVNNGDKVEMLCFNTRLKPATIETMPHAIVAN